MLRKLSFRFFVQLLLLLVMLCFSVSICLPNYVLFYYSDCESKANIWVSSAPVISSIIQLCVLKTTLTGNNAAKGYINTKYVLND